MPLNVLISCPPVCAVLLADGASHAVRVEADDLPVVGELGVGEQQGGRRGEKQGEHQQQTRRMHRRTRSPAAQSQSVRDTAERPARHLRSG